MTQYHTQLHRLYKEDKSTFDREFYEIVVRLVRAIVSRYPPDVYNNNEPWAESYEVVVQDVYLERLLDTESNQLDYIMTEATSIESIERLLKRQIRQVIRQRARRTPVDNVMRRIRDLADAGKLGRRRLQRTTYYGSLLASDFEPVQTTEADLNRAANRAREVPILWGRPDAERESRLYSEADLLRLMGLIISEISCISESDLWRILENLLTSFVPTTLYIDEELGDTDVERTNMNLVVEVEQQIRNFVDDLDPRELYVLVAKSQGVADTKISSYLNVTRPTVIAMKDRLGQRMAQVFRDFGVDDSVEVISRRIIEFATIRLAQEDGAA